MKTLYLSIILFTIIIYLGFGGLAHGDNLSSVYVQNIKVQPSIVKVGNSFTVTATLINNSTFPIWVDGAKCSIKDTQASFLTIVFDVHAKIKGKDVNCAGVGWSQILEPGKNLIATSPDYTVNYIATKAGTANATVTFSYHVINQTDPTQPGFSGNISKSILFTILDNGTGVGNQLPIGTPFKSILDTPLKQFKSGISASDAKCADGFALVIKSEDNSPACVKLSTAYMLIKRGWASSESAYPEGNPQFALKTNSTIIPGHMPYSSGLKIPYQESSQVINYTGFDNVYNTTLMFRGTPPDYVLKPGTTGTITFKIEAMASEMPGQQYPVPLPKSLNLTNYAVFYHEITNPATLSKYPGVTMDDGHFRACFTRPASGGTCIGGPYDVKGQIEAYVVDHPGVNVLFEPPSEVLPLGTNMVSQIVTMTITVDNDAPQGTYLVEVPSFDEFLLTVGNQPYHE